MGLFSLYLRWELIFDFNVNALLGKGARSGIESVTGCSPLEIANNAPGEGARDRDLLLYIDDSARVVGTASVTGRYTPAEPTAEPTDALHMQQFHTVD